MSMDVGGSKGGIKSDINVTPLVDVMLVLLIIMMIVAPLLQKGADVRLPLATAHKTDQAGAPGTTAFASVEQFAQLRVLVAEDNPVNVMVIRGVLAKFSIAPDVASDGGDVVAGEGAQRNRDLAPGGAGADGQLGDAA